MSVGKLPEEWKHSLVTPVYKSGPASCVVDCSPIYLAFVASKLMEDVVVNETLFFMHARFNT